MRSATFPESVDLTPGDPACLTVSITNTTTAIDAYQVQVFGLDPEWIVVEPASISLFPGQTENVEVRLSLPDDYPASHRTLAVNVTSSDDPSSFALNQVELSVQPRTQTSIRLDPVLVTAGRRATFGMVVSNVGNATVEALGYAIDPEDLATFEFSPQRVLVPPGREQVIEITASGGRAWFGQQRARTFTFGVEAEQRVETLGTFVQRPRIGRWLISLLGLLTAAAVFAAVLSRTFDRVVDEAQVSTELLDNALKRDEAGGAIVPTNPGGVSGRILTSTTGQGLSGAQAELFVADDTSNPVASAATDSDGAFTFANLGAGSYKLLLSGAGVNGVWYGDSATAADGRTITVELGDVNELDPISVGGIPVDVTGVIAVDDPTGVTVSLVVPGPVEGGQDSVVAQVALAPDGSFTLPDIPSPGNYELIVQKPGSPPESRPVNLEPGKPLADVAVMVQPGAGLISGTVTGPNGSLGGATVTANDGSVEIATVSLTENPVGYFELRNLETPGQYTVTIERDGYAPEARTVSLTTDQTTGTFDARLVPATGSISGLALVDGAAARGLQVVVAGGDINRTAGVVSQGPQAGQYSFTGLEAPGTYTLTFSGGGTIPQVRVVDLDPNVGQQDVTGVDVAMSREVTSVSGIIRGPDGNPIGQATISLSDGAIDRTVLSADSPIGRFEFSNVEPKAYTLTASRTGTEPVVVLVNVSSTSGSPSLDLQLGEQASITGSVTGFETSTRSLPVKLFKPEQFPNGIPVATTTTNADGTFRFSGLEAPVTYVVAIYADTASADPLDSTIVNTEPGRPQSAATFTVMFP